MLMQFDNGAAISRPKGLQIRYVIMFRANVNLRPQAADVSRLIVKYITTQEEQFIAPPA